MDINLSLADVLTAGGVTATAALVWGLIAMGKKLPGIGERIDGGIEPVIAYILSAILVVLAFIQQVPGEQNAVSGFGAFLAWYAIANVSGAIHDQVKDRTTSTKRTIVRTPNG